MPAWPIIDDEDITDRWPDGIHVTGPGFPHRPPSSTAAPVLSKPTAPVAAASYMRARTEIETDGKTGRQSIILHRNSLSAEQGPRHRKNRRTGQGKEAGGHQSELRDESDKDGMRIVIEVKRGEVAEVVVNNLFAQTRCKACFSINMVALVRRPAAHPQPEGHDFRVCASPP
jgi:DNA gyrase subunit A